jgi:hypothetical protein
MNAWSHSKRLARGSRESLSFSATFDWSTMRLSHYVTLAVPPEPDSRTIVLGCFSEPATIERLIIACAPAGTVERSASRTCIVRRATRPNVALVILPTLDGEDIPTAPLIAELRARDVAVAVCMPPGASSRGLVDAIRAGADVLMWATPNELAERVLALSSRPAMAEEEVLALSHIVQDLSPASLREMLSLCTAHAHRRLSVTELAAILGVSSRTVCRVASQAGWPAPAEVILWGRIFRVALARWSGVDRLTSLVRASGFANVHALYGVAVRRLRVCDDISELTPLRASQALQRRLRRVVTKQRTPQSPRPASR